MKGIRRAILGNQEYHHNLLGEEFDELVETVTEKSLARPNAEANRDVILAINDPNTGMELTPQKVSQELRKQLRSTNPQKQWLAAVLIRDVLAECGTVMQPVVAEILEAVSIVASTEVSTAGQASRNAKEVAAEILTRHGRGERQSAAHGRPRVPNAIVSARQKEPQRSLHLIEAYGQGCRNHCEVVRELITGGEGNEAALVGELFGEVKEMRKALAKAVERLSNHDGAHVEAAIATAIDAIDLVDKLIELHAASKNGELKELTMRDLPTNRTPSRSLDLLGNDTRTPEDPSPERSRSLDAFGLNALEEGLQQSTPQHADDPFQSLANAPVSPPSTSQPQNVNPFADNVFRF